jgi:hypothetical protein
MLSVKIENGIAILEPKGELSSDDFKSISNVIDPYIQKHGKLQGAVIYVQSFPGWDSFAALSSHIHFIKEHHKKISRLAICTDSVIGNFAESIGNIFVNAEIKKFDYKDFNEAEIWASGEYLYDEENHGISIGMYRFNDEYFLSLKAKGKLTHDDYKKLIPIIDSTLKEVKDPKVKLLVDISEFEGWEIRAAWDDFRMGLKYNNVFEKIAMVGNKNWQDIGAKIASWFISGEIKAFEDKKEAIKWLNSK